MRLFVLEPDSEPRELHLSGPVVSIGRSPDNDVEIGDVRSSRRHCRLTESSDGVVLEDLGSSNGTTHNGSPVERIVLSSGDEFRIGATRFFLERLPTGSTRETTPVPGSPEASDEGEDDAVEIEFGTDDDELLLDEEDDDAATDSDDRVELLIGWMAPAKDASARVEIGHVPFRIGRGTENDLVVPDPRVSSVHAEITLRDGKPFLQDLGSRIGIVVGGRRGRKAVLADGMEIGFGKEVYRVSLAPTAGAAKGSAARTSAATRASGGADAGTLDIDIERLQTSAAWERPVAIVIGLLVTLSLAYFAIDISRRIFVREDLDPAATGNRIANWSFELPVPEGADSKVPAWTLNGDGASAVLAEDAARVPGRVGLRVSSGGVSALVAQDDPVAVGREGRFFLQGTVTCESSFAAALVVDWLRGAGSRAEVVGRSYSVAARGRGAVEQVEQFVSVPEGATQARVACLVVGPGSASFDRISLSSSESDSALAPGGEESTDAGAAGTLSRRDVERADEIRFGPEDDPVVIASSGAGLLELSRGARKQLDGIWACFDADRDPLALGSALVANEARARKGGGRIFRSALPDLVDASWTELTSELQLQGDRATLAFQPAGEGPPLRICLATRNSSLGLVAHRAEGESETFIWADAKGGPFDELVVGTGEQRTSLAFARPVRLRSFAHPVSKGLLVLEASPEPGTGAEGREVRIVFSHGSLREARAAKALVAEAEKAFEEERPAEAIAILDRVIRELGDLEGERRRAEERRAAWVAEIDSVASDLEVAIDALSSSPSQVAFDSLLARARALSTSYGGTSAGQRVDRARERLESLASSRATQRARAAVESLLTDAQAHFGAGRLASAELLLRLLLEDTSAEATVRDAATALLERIRTRVASQRTSALAEGGG